MVRLKARAPILAALLLVVLTGTASAIRPSKSIYTALDLAHCRDVANDRGRRSLICDGLQGFPIHIGLGDLHYFVSVGPDGATRRAASQTLAPYNSLFPVKSRRAAIEWRFIIRDEKPVPYAMIVRYFTKQGNKRGQVLVVTRITDHEACHVAHIDAMANSDAIMLARRIADEQARTFDCKNEPLRIGAVGKSPM